MTGRLERASNTIDNTMIMEKEKFIEINFFSGVFVATSISERKRERRLIECWQQFMIMVTAQCGSIQQAISNPSRCAHK